MDENETPVLSAQDEPAEEMTTAQSIYWCLVILGWIPGAILVSSAIFHSGVGWWVAAVIAGVVWLLVCMGPAIMRKAQPGESQ